MGLEDRDYYRDDYAKKNGMRYNAKNGTYRKAPDYQEQASGSSSPVQPANEFSFIGKLAITVCVFLGAALAYRYLR